MDYLVFYRILTQSHPIWGPQWSYENNVLEMSSEIHCVEALEEIKDFLEDFHKNRQVEVISICPIG